MRSGESAPDRPRSRVRARRRARLRDRGSAAQRSCCAARARAVTGALAVLAALAAVAALAPRAALAIERGAGASRISDADSASEYWDIVAHFDTNHQLFARFLITNEGPGERTAIATWLLIDPEGRRREFRNGRREERWTLSPGGDRMEIGSSIFDRSGPVHRLEYDSTKRGIRVAFQYAPRGPVAWPRIWDDRYAFDLLELATPVTGTIWLEGMPETARVSGTISITHTSMEQSEAELTLRRIDFTSTASGTAVFLSDRMTPSGARERWLVAARDGQVLAERIDFELAVVGTAANGSGEYPTPERLEIRGSGVEGAIQSRSTLAAVDPLEAIPQPFRFLLSFKMRPQRAWTRASYEVRLRSGPDGSETVLKGSGVGTITFTNPLPRKLRDTETEIPGA